MKAQISEHTSLEFDDTGSGQPLVLLHAFPLDGTMWRPQIATLRDAYRVIVPDFRGFGGSSRFEDAPSVERLADDVAAVLDSLSLRGPVYLGGLSMGGYVALAFARRHPERLKALIFADTRAEPDNAEGKAKRDETIEFMRTHSARELIDQMMPKLVSEGTISQQRDVVDEVRRIAAAQTPEAIIDALQVLRDRPDSLPTLATIAVPTLVMVGSDDALTPPTMAETLAAGITGARLEKIADAGHLSNIEQPALFNAAVRSFLESIP